MNRRGLVLLAPLAAALPPVLAEPAGVRLRTPRHASGRDPLGGYAPELLSLALSHLPRRYHVEESPESLAQGRAVFEMLKLEPPIDVFWTVTTPERQAALRAIRIPIERGLIGWRVALVRRADQDLFAGVRTLAELAGLRAGQKHDWPDVGILRANGLNVETSSQYESLFRMLSMGRIDYFPRSVLEIQAELDARPALDLVIEPHLGLRYPSALYFFVAPGRDELAADIRLGLEKAQADGSFEKLFQRHFRDTVEALRLRNRRVFELRNPTLPADVPLQRTDWWLKPARP